MFSFWCVLYLMCHKTHTHTNDVAYSTLDIYKRCLLYLLSGGTEREKKQVHAFEMTEKMFSK